MTDPRAAAVEAAAHASDSEFGTMCNNDCNRATKCVAACQDTIDHAQTMIRAYEARMAEAGWVMVPREATQEMLPQAWRTIRHHGGQGVDHDCLRAVWSAMIRAAMLGQDDPPRADVKQPPQIIEDVSDE